MVKMLVLIMELRLIVMVLMRFRWWVRGILLLWYVVVNGG